jgi:hypothetical protein
LQATFGTMETSLATTCFVAMIKPTISYEPTVTPIEMVGGGFANTKSVIGPYNASLKGGLPLRNAAQDSPGPWSLFIKCMGFLESAVTHVYTYTPSDSFSEWSDMTCFGYTGNMANSFVHKAGNLMGGGKLSFDFEKATVQIDADMNGLFSGALVTGAQPSVTRSTVAISPCRGATISILGDANIVPVSLEIDLGQEAKPTVSPAQTSGLGINLVTKRKIKWSAKVYMDTLTNPTTAQLAATTAVISVQWGTAPNKFTVSLTQCQIEKATPSDINGYAGWDLSGIVENNAMSIVTDTTSA